MRTTLALAVAALGLAACGTPTIVVNPATPPAPAATSATPTPPPAAVADDGRTTGEAQLLNFLDDRGLGYADPDDVLEAANGVCEFLDAGNSAAELLAIAYDKSGDDPELIATVTAGAVVFICPRHEAALDAALGAAS